MPADTPTPPDARTLAEQALALDADASPGPWTWVERWRCGHGPTPDDPDTMPALLDAEGSAVMHFGNAENFYATEGMPPANVADERLIAFSRSALPALARRIIELEAAHSAPAVHYSRIGRFGPACGAEAPTQTITSDILTVTCRACLVRGLENAEAHSAAQTGWLAGIAAALGGDAAGVDDPESIVCAIERLKAAACRFVRAADAVSTADPTPTLAETEEYDKARHGLAREMRFPAALTPTEEATSGDE